MKIIQMHALQGANVHSYKPVLWIQLFLGALSDTPSSGIVGFTSRLLELLPGLKEHHCSLGYAGGFVERLHEGTYLAHIFEHVLLELQTLCGDKVGYGKARIGKKPGMYDVIASYRSEAVARACARLAQRLLAAVLEGNAIDLETELEAIRARRDKERVGPSAEAIYDAAVRRGIPVRKFAGEDLMLLGQGKHMRKVWSTVTQNTSLLATDLVADKFLTTRLLAESGIPTPENRIVETEEEAARAFAWLGKNVVLKPLAGSHGRGVTVGVADEAGVRRAFRLASDYGEKVLVERCVTGRQYRICTVNYKFAAAAERIPAYVIGDGQHTVAELVEIANRNPLRGDGHDKPLTRIEIDAFSLAVLSKQGLTPNLVPEAKRVVQIKETANLSTGGTAVDVTAIVHPETVAMAERIAEIVGLDISGIDIISPDITKPLSLAGGAVIEVNAAPGIRMHHHPSAGQPRDVGGEIVDYLFPYGSDGRIPVIAVTGTNGKTTTTRMLGGIFGEAGYTVGMSTTEGVYVHDRCILRGDCSGPKSARMLFEHSKVDLAVLETARGGILRAGLGFDRCDVGVVTNISEDHLGQDGVETLEDLAHIKSLVLEMAPVRGTAVINADDAFATYFASRVQSEVVYFSAEPSNILVRRHLGTGGKAVFLKGETIFLAVGSASEALLDIGQIPTTLGGRARHNVENALAAAAAAFGYGVDMEAIRRGLANFAQNVGRMNLFAVRDFNVCLDYGHNLAGYQAVLCTARQMNAKRLVGVIAAPGDRRDDTIFQLGKIAGEGFDRIYIKEDADLRGRKTGETAALLKAGVLAAGFGEAALAVVLSETQAVRAALEDAKEGDFIVVFFERYDSVVEVLEAYRQEEEPETPSVYRPEATVAANAEIFAKNSFLRT